MVWCLTGCMGSGKTTIGKLLADCRFIDLDSLIERQQGRKVQEIFAKEGEAAFRRMELEALQEAISSYEGGTLLIALGGGTLMTPECRELVRMCSHCIYLRATAKTLAERLKGETTGRPLLAGKGELEAKLSTLLAVRGPVYEAASQHIIDTDNLSPDAIAEIVSHLLK